MNKDKIVYRVELGPLPLFKRGKTRDVFDLGDKLLIVATDRISCFDVVLPTAIPGKGYVLTALSKFWFDYLKDIVSNHYLSDDICCFQAGLEQFGDLLAGRSLLVKKATPIKFECIVRGFLTGSALKEYLETGTFCGIELPQGLKEASRLDEPIFTPSTKAESGHDVNISFDQMVNELGQDISERLKSISLALYQKASAYALTKGIIIADTKFEFGLAGSELILIDEVLTPDSSRFWPAAGYDAGKKQISLDKQYVRDYLETLKWDKTAPGPELPDEIVQKTSEKYLTILNMLTSN